MQMQMRFEDCMVERAEKACESDSNMRAIIICDRGTMDGKAYVFQKYFFEIFLLHCIIFFFSFLANPRRISRHRRPSPFFCPHKKQHTYVS